MSLHLCASYVSCQSASARRVYGVVPCATDKLWGAGEECAHPLGTSDRHFLLLLLLFSFILKSPPPSKMRNGREAPGRNQVGSCADVIDHD